MKITSQFPVTLNWVTYKSNYKIPIIYDGNVQLMNEFNAFLLDIAKQKIINDPRKQAYKSETELKTYAIKSFAEFLSEKNINWQTINDVSLEQYRNWAFSKTLSNKISKKQENAAKRTTNIKLRIIYQFYVWAQDTMFYLQDIIGLGKDMPINSILAESMAGKDVKKNDKRIYPLCYSKCGEGSRSSDQYFATAEDKRKLIKFFTENSNTPYLAERNILIMELANQRGWRAGSLTSLTIDDFSDSKIDSATEKGIFVIPSIQKNGYDKSFIVSLALAIRVNKHINKARKNLTETTGDHSDGSLFLNEDSGEGLGDQTITQIFSSAMKQVGCPKGSGIHSFRRKFAQDLTDKEIEFRKQNNLSMAIEDTQHVIANALGQVSLASQELYVKARTNEAEKTLEAKLLQENNLLSSDLANALFENQRLQKLLENN